MTPKRSETAAAREVADGIYRLGTKWVNCYVVREGSEAILVDAGYPRYRRPFAQALDSLGLHEGAIAAVIVTHHHVDHMGTAESFRRSGARVIVHRGDAPIVRGDRPSHVPPGFYRQSWRPSMARYLAHTVVAGGARYPPVESIEILDDDAVLDLPGRPRVIPTPGHTQGHCSVLVQDRGVLFAGDAMVNFDYATGMAGLGQHRFNEDRGRALASLERLDRLDAEVVLFGHGDPWRGGSQQAIDRVREAV